MTLRARIPDEVLNAYVDGALAPAEAADLATRALAEPELAARIARLHGLKAGVAALADVTATPPLPAVSPRRGSPRPPVRPGLAAMAAAALVMLALGVAAPRSQGPAPLPAAGPDPAVSLALSLAAHHDAWALAAADGTPQAPDWLTAVMAGAGLRLVHAAPLPQGGGLHLAFIGRNACRISLFERPDPGTPGAPVLSQRDRLLDARWHSGMSGFVLIARDMNPDRFATIAAALAEASLTRDRPGPELIASLILARQPCLG